SLIIWDTHPQAEQLTLHEDRPVNQWPDSGLIVAETKDGTIKILDPITGVSWLYIYGHKGGCGHAYAELGCAISPDGSFIVSASSDGVKIWDTATGALRLTWQGEEEFFTFRGVPFEVLDCTISPDGKFVVSTSSDGELKIWDVLRNNCVATFFSNEN